MPDRNESKFSYLKVLLIAAALGLLTLGYVLIAPTAGPRIRDFFYPFLRGGAWVGGEVRDRMATMLPRAELGRVIATLRRENHALKIAASGTAETIENNRQLRRLLNLRPPASWRYIYAEWLLKSDASRGALVLDRGYDDGVKSGSAAMVLDDSGQLALLGIIREVGKHTCVVVTPREASLRLSVRLPQSDAVGFLNCGDAAATGDTVPVGMLPLREYTIDEGVLSSGLERAVPPGIRIGNLVAAERNDNFFSEKSHLSGLVRLAVDSVRCRPVVIAVRSLDAGSVAP